MLRMNKEKVLACITPEQIKTIQKDNPFRFERNRLIRDLRRKGVTHRVISEISGLCLVQVKGIAGKMPKYDPLAAAIEGVRADVGACLNDLLKKIESRITP